ncbi:gastrokine-2-like [Rhinophrynus dorsalis]
MSQKHTEEIVRMVFNSKDGEKVQQTISYNEQENLAAVFVNANNYSATVLYDYKRDLIGFRQSNGKKCFVMKMNKFITPPMSSVISGIKYFQTHKVPVDTDVSYNIIEGEEANPKDLGISINILCSDVPIYWGKQSNTEHRFKISFKFKVLGIPVKVTIGK